MLANQVIDLDNLDVRDEERSKKPKIAEHTETLQLFCDIEEKIIKISSTSVVEEMSMLTRCLKDNLHMFSLSAANMPRVDHQVVVHKLNVLSKAKLVK